MEPGNNSPQGGVTYNYEALLDEHFQHLIQTLLILEYPNVQCFPVGMPDGGRDALIRTTGPGVDNTVAQVKFVRNPAKIKDAYKWFVKTINEEIPKIAKLVERGASKYMFVSNLPASSHLDVGLIDKATTYLRENVEIPAVCLWRDDLDRRLDRAYDVKLRFPHLLNGPDLLRLMWESPYNLELGRRRATLEAYLRDQYRTDENLRFKQVEMLTTKLFDLFIDVPLFPTPRESHRSSVDGFPDAAFGDVEPEDLIYRMASTGRSGLYRRYVHLAGAARVLCDDTQLRLVRRVVIEGAPGQGKTTLTQYIAQIQRARFLGREEVINSLPEEHTRAPSYLPLKIELRDLSHWLNGRDPWSADPEATHNEVVSLESALAAHIRRYSGGAKFDVDDLRAVLENTPTLIILDALDEVADLDDRKQVVAEVEAASDRLDGPQHSIVFLVTSRPTAISSAPKFDRAKFVHYSLQAITSGLASAYARRWSSARGIPMRDAEELQEILEAKLESPHMAELARNTMQLTILLSLILSRGSSLPDKRTELYSSYLDLFLSRESDKSAAVRKNRSLILDLHGHLAYSLHAKAEGQRTTGRITTSELREQVSVYLHESGHSPSLADELFDAMVQRVVALVSRVEGTFEFEVQPLREYFAARHLYHTAPYSPTGKERKGTKPDRFDGVAPNPYWMNVTRFYAGFFSKGEIMDLAHRVCQLIDTSTQPLAAYPRRLALALLQDWVFSQIPLAVNMVVERLLDDDGLVWAANLRPPERHISLGHETDGFELWPDGGGAEYASEIVWNRIQTDFATDWCIVWCSLMTAVAPVAYIRDRWTEYQAQLHSLKARSRWLAIGDALGLMPTVSSVEYPSMLMVDEPRYLSSRAISLRACEQHFQFLRTSEQQHYVRSVLELGSARPIDAVDESPASHAAFLLLSHPALWRSRFSQRARSGMLLKIADRADPYYTASTTLSHALGGNISGSLEPWEQAVETIEDSFGRNLNTIELSCAAAGIISAAERGRGVTNLIDAEQISLPRRFRFARRQSNRPDWWTQQFDRATSAPDAQTWLMALLSLASGETIMKFLPRLNDVVGIIGDERAERLIDVLESRRSPKRSIPARDYAELKSAIGTEPLTLTGMLLLATRATEQFRRSMVDAVATYLPRPSATRFVFPFLVDDLFASTVHDVVALSKLKECTAGVLESAFLDSPAISNLRGSKYRSSEWFAIIRREAMDLPPLLVHLVTAMESRGRVKATPVLKIANAEGWFGK